MRKAKRYWWMVGAGLLVAVLAALAYPIDSVTVPAWRLQVLDAIGRPLKALPLRQAWRDYAVDGSDRQAEARTDDKGNVVLPRRLASASPLSRLILSLYRRARGGVTGTGVTGVASWIVQRCDLVEAGAQPAVYGGGTLPARITLNYHAAIAAGGAMPKPAECAALEAQAQQADRLQ